MNGLLRQQITALRIVDSNNDAVVLGEGEYCFTRFCLDLLDGGDGTGISDVAVRGHPVNRSHERIADMDS